MAQHKSGRATTEAANRGGAQSKRPASAGRALLAGISAVKTAARSGPPAPAETIEARLDRKAAIADSQTPAPKSLGEMSREQRHKLLYRD